MVKDDGQDIYDNKEFRINGEVRIRFNQALQMALQTQGITRVYGCLLPGLQPGERRMLIMGAGSHKTAEAIVRGRLGEGPYALAMPAGGVGLVTIESLAWDWLQAVQREPAPDLACTVVQVGENHARFGDRDIGLGTDRAQPVHPPQRQDQRAAIGGWRGPGDHARIAALWNQRHIMLRGEGDDRGNVCRCGWRQDRQRLAMVAAAPVGQPRFDL